MIKANKLNNQTLSNHFEDFLKLSKIESSNFCLESAVTNSKGGVDHYQEKNKNSKPIGSFKYLLHKSFQKKFKDCNNESSSNNKYLKIKKNISNIFKNPEISHLLEESKKNLLQNDLNLSHNKMTHPHNRILKFNYKKENNISDNKLQNVKDNYEQIDEDLNYFDNDILNNIIYEKRNSDKENLIPNTKNSKTSVNLKITNSIKNNLSTSYKKKHTHINEGISNDFKKITRQTIKIKPDKTIVNIKNNKKNDNFRETNYSKMLVNTDNENSNWISSKRKSFYGKMIDHTKKDQDKFSTPKSNVKYFFNITSKYGSTSKILNSKTIFNNHVKSRNFNSPLQIYEEILSMKFPMNDDSSINRTFKKKKLFPISNQGAYLEKIKNKYEEMDSHYYKNCFYNERFCHNQYYSMSHDNKINDISNFNNFFPPDIYLEDHRIRENNLLNYFKVETVESNNIHNIMNKETQSLIDSRTIEKLTNSLTNQLRKIKKSVSP